MGDWSDSPDTGGVLQEFAERWGLDSSSMDMLRALDESTLSTVLNEFAPRGNTHDVGGKLLAFVRSVQNKNSTLQVASPIVEAFVAKWGLDGAATAWLMSLPPTVTEIVAAQFDPKEDTQNIMGKLRGFARSVQARVPNNPQQAERMVNLKTQLLDFGAKWGLDDSALASLGAMPADVQFAVIRDFEPKGDIVNVNGKVLSFARSIMARQRVPSAPAVFSPRPAVFSPRPMVYIVPGRAGSLDPAEVFAARWQLDDTMRRFILELPQDVRSTVIAQFDPAADTRNVAGKLRTFANGILAAANAGQLRGSHATQSHAASGLAMPSSANPVISDFAMKWSLDSGDVTLLESLPEDALNTVMEQFAPRSDTRSVSAKLRAFANTVVSGGKGKGRGSTPSQGPASSLEQRGAAMPDQDTNEFLERWGLLEDHSAAECLRRLPSAVRQRVMTEFLPGSDTLDVGGELVGFANSVARAAPLHQPWHFPQQATLVAPSCPSRQQIAQSHLPCVDTAGMTPEQFADHWQLDEGSRALLRGLDPVSQAAVIAEFQPRSDVRDPSGRFCSFARSVAARHANGQSRTGGGFACAGGLPSGLLAGGGLKRGPQPGAHVPIAQRPRFSY